MNLTTSRVTGLKETEIESLRQRVERAWNSDQFRQAGEIVVSKLAKHLRQVQGGAGFVSNWQPPAEMIRLADKFLSNESDYSSELMDQLTQAFLEHSQNLHHPRYIGHQVPASAPLAGLFDALGSVTNQVMGIYEMGPFSTAAERAVINRLADAIGWKENTFSGVVTHGGSLANLTALLTARNVQFPESWSKGIGTDQVKVIANGDAHYCIHRAAGILGIGTDSVVHAPLTSQRKIDPAELEKMLVGFSALGVPVLAVAASACSTPIGAFDDLEAVADVCERQGVWLHVDAAHGGGALLSERHRDKLAGIHRADSIVWDAHKMMFVPALCAFVYFKKREHGFAPFQQKAPYLFDESDTSTHEYDSAVRTLECTKRAAALGVWGLWSLFGKQLFGDLVDLTFAMTGRFREMLEADGGFEVPFEPEANILIFRLQESVSEDSPEELSEQNRRHSQLRRTLVRDGKFYITQTELEGRIWLRITVMNPLTTMDDFSQLIDEIKRLARLQVG